MHEFLHVKGSEISVALTSSCCQSGCRRHGCAVTTDFVFLPRLGGAPRAPPFLPLYRVADLVKPTGRTLNRDA